MNQRPNSPRAFSGLGCVLLTTAAPGPFLFFRGFGSLLPVKSCLISKGDGKTKAHNIALKCAISRDMEIMRIKTKRVGWILESNCIVKESDLESNMKSNCTVNESDPKSKSAPTTYPTRPRLILLHPPHMLHVILLSNLCPPLTVFLETFIESPFLQSTLNGPTPF